MLTAFPDAVHVAKNDRASFANWYRFVDGNRINLVLLRTARVDPNSKHLLMSHLSLAACRNRDRMDVDTVIEICSPEVQQGLANAKLKVQALIPEVYRIYEQGGSVKESSLSMPSILGNNSSLRQRQGKDLLRTLTLPSRRCRSCFRLK